MDEVLRKNIVSYGFGEDEISLAEKVDLLGRGDSRVLRVGFSTLDSRGTLPVLFARVYLKDSFRDIEEFRRYLDSNNISYEGNLRGVVGQDPAFGFNHGRFSAEFY